MKILKKLLKLPLHIQIVVSIIAGVCLALFYINANISPVHAQNWLKPWGEIFVRLLKMIAVPLVLASLVTGVAKLGDTQKLSKLGTKTICIYISTTILATTVGLLLVNIIKPGSYMDPDTRDSIVSTVESENKEKLAKRQAGAQVVSESSPLQAFVDMVPDNIFKAMTNNSAMLQVVFFALVLGLASLTLGSETARPLVELMHSLNDHIMKIIEFIMALAPIGVFCLIASLLIDVAGNNPANALTILKTLGVYSLTVILGLAVMALVVYPILIKTFSNMKVVSFFRKIAPAQLLAFSTSSSSATLPVTMEVMEKELNVSEEVCSFVLPLGATINMDGTCLYQSVAAVFIMQCFGIDLSLADQLMIVVTATLASIGSAGVPGAGMVMLIIVLQAIQPQSMSSEAYAAVIASGIALIMAPDRFLDMCRTSVNVTGDCTVTAAVAGRENWGGHHGPED